MLIRTVTVTVLLACLLAAPAISQTTSTEILGTVSDPTGAVIPAAKVTLLRVATGERRETNTGTSGDYSFPLIEIGEYIVTTEAAGFKTAEQKGILVQLQQKARVNFVMEVGAATERIEVVATGFELKTDDAAVGQVIDNRRVVELPLNGRNIAGLAVLTPGVQYGIRMGLDGQGTGAFPFPGAATAISANGQRELNQQVTLDGVTAAEPLINVMLFTPSIDAIEEFKVQTSSYSAEYGMNSGAVVQVALKSGTNDFRGTIYEFLRNDTFDAKDYFLNFQLPPGAQEQQKNRLRRNQFGAFVSGPVSLPKIYQGRDRTFWSFNYEGKRETRESVQEAFWFPEEFRRGDFSALLRPLIRDGRPVRAPIIIYDPMTGEPFRDGGGNITNIIPQARINRNAQDVVNTYLPLPMFSPADILDVNVRRSVPNIWDTNQYFARIDHQFNSNNRVFGRIAIDRTRYDAENLNPNFPTNNTTASTNIAFQFLHMFSPTTLNEFRYGFNRNNLSIFHPRTGTDFDPDSLGVGNFRVGGPSGRKFTPRETGVPPMGVIGGDAIGRDVFSDVHQFTDNLTLIRGSHSFKAGFEYRFYDLYTVAANVPVGNLTCCEGGYALAGWLMGYPSTSSTAEGLPPTNPRQNRWGAYFLDEWKVTRKLTANIGLRWDFFQVPLDAAAGMRSLRLDILTQTPSGSIPTLIPAPETANFPLYNTDNRYFMPRVGLAYRVTDGWVIRTGAGWFANAQQLNNMTVLALLPPRSGTINYPAVTDTAQVIPYQYAGQSYSIQTRRFRAGSPVVTMDSIYPGQGTTAARTNLTSLPPDNKYSSHVQWSFDIQRSFPWDMYLTIGYVGSKTSHLDNSVGTFNSPDPSPDTDINRRRPYQSYVSQGEGDQVRALGNIRYLDSYANSNYHGLQVGLEKRYSAGLTMGIAYTYSKTLGEGYGRNDSGADVNTTYQNPRDRRGARSRMGFDVTHNFVFNYVYEMPFLNRFKGVAGAIIGGWQTNGIVTLRTGFPFTLTGGNLNTGGTVYPDRIADGRLFDEATRERWFDKTAFRRTECNIPGRLDLCHYGNAGAAPLDSPGAQNFDLSVYKNWGIKPLGEGARLQFRVEFFNAFNTPQFGRPNLLTFVSNESVVPDGPRDAEIRTLRLPMRIIQLGLKLYF